MLVTYVQCPTANIIIHIMMCNLQSQSAKDPGENYGPCLRTLRKRKPVPSSETYIVWHDNDDDEITVMECALFKTILFILF